MDDAGWLVGWVVVFFLVDDGRRNGSNVCFKPVPYSILDEYFIHLIYTYYIYKTCSSSYTYACYLFKTFYLWMNFPFPNTLHLYLSCAPLNLLSPLNICTDINRYMWYGVQNFSRYDDTPNLPQRHQSILKRLLNIFLCFYKMKRIKIKTNLLNQFIYMFDDGHNLVIW